MEVSLQNIDLMCFGGIALPKPYRYTSLYTTAHTATPLHPMGIPKMKVRCRPDVAGNFHWWCVDNNGKILDPTPQPLPHPEAIDNNAIYIPWSDEEQNELFDRLTMAEWGGYPPPDQIDSCYNYPQPKHCFENAIAKSMKDDLKLVCGSMGYIVREAKDYKEINLDYGF